MQRAIANNVVCEECGHDHIKQIVDTFEFKYGLGTEQVTLVADVPFFECQACHLKWTAPEAERIQNEVVAQHLGRLRGSQIRHFRHKTGLTQEEFAKIAGVGVASLKRWETGHTVPNQSCSALLENVMRKLSLNDGDAFLGDDIKSSSNFPRKRNRFRTSLSTRTRAAAMSFNFRSPFPQVRQQAA